MLEDSLEGLEMMGLMPKWELLEVGGRWWVGGWWMGGWWVVGCGLEVVGGWLVVGGG